MDLTLSFFLGLFKRTAELWIQSFRIAVNFQILSFEEMVSDFAKTH
jgi:hypothetical protein